MTPPEGSRSLPLLSLRNLVLFPGAVMPVEIGRLSSLRLIESLPGKGTTVSFLLPLHHPAAGERGAFAA